MGFFRSFIQSALKSNVIKKVPEQKKEIAKKIIKTKVRGFFLVLVSQAI